CARWDYYGTLDYW
nr:immunoglobulin heavy chain junction region [Mus musculus]